MNAFFFDIFFDLNHFSHKKIFKDQAPVWWALSCLPDYFKTKKLGRIYPKIPDGVFLINPEEISIGKGTEIESGAFIKGPCIIGENCQIRQSAYIRGGVITGDCCVIGHATEIKNSILLSYVSAAHFAYIGDSILGNNVNLGAGVKCANFRLDKQEISFSLGGKRVNTGLNKFGAVVGDNVQIGCNTVLNPATFLGKDSICYPSLNISGYIKERSVIKSSSTLIINNTRANELS
jgi:UDP-N-acetylglucosamine diphosphorylase / glucose-1-phosphate thymidylyltransferase / UDP-N-acetylgalactosamine diphosphorylase / glucosamine-1-phosphate N-acetyltransferase / galactosamine-1-phosphate N-acetyltransferase